MIPPFGRWITGIVGAVLLFGLAQGGLAQQGETNEEVPTLTSTTPAIPPGTELPPGGAEMTPTTGELAPFGYDQLRAASQGKVPGASPIPDFREDYRLGSGDLVGIYLWGRTQLTLSGTIGVEGNLFIPTLGMVRAGGLTLSQFQSEMDSVVRRNYRDVQIECTLLRPRQIPVWVTGEVKKPGRYVINALATLSQAITTAQGPLKQASLRHIRIRHATGDSSESDLYGLLARGDRTQDLPLESGDVIFLPACGLTVKISGEVRRPAIYELKGGERLSDAIELAGGYTSAAYLEKVQFNRRFLNNEKRLVYVNCKDPNSPEGNPPVVGDEEIRVLVAPWFQAGKIKTYFATIEGEVHYPGVYAIIEGDPISTLIKRAGGFTPLADLKQAKFIRPTISLIEDKELIRIKKTPDKDRSESEKEYLQIKEEQEPPEFLIIDFQKLWVTRDPKQDIGLKDGDRIVVPKRVETVSLTGRFNRPGSVVYKRGATAEYYIKQAGGLAWNANSRGMRIIKPSGQRLLPKEAGELEPGDTIWVPKKGQVNWWGLFKDVSRTAFEVASIYLILWQVTK